MARVFFSLCAAEANILWCEAPFFIPWLIVVRVIFSSFPITALHKRGVRGSSGQSRSPSVHSSCLWSLWWPLTNKDDCIHGHRWWKRENVVGLPQIKISRFISRSADFSHFPNFVGQETHSVPDRRSTFGNRCYDSYRKLWPQCASSLAPVLPHFCIGCKYFIKCKWVLCSLVVFQRQLFSFLGRFPVSSYEGYNATFHPMYSWMWGVVQRT